MSKKLLDKNGLSYFWDKIKSYVSGEVNTKSAVSVSNTGTATDEVSYITVDGVEKKIGGGGTPGNMVTTNTNQTITGTKTFTGSINIANESRYQGIATEDGYLIIQGSGKTSSFGNPFGKTTIKSNVQPKWLNNTSIEKTLATTDQIPTVEANPSTTTETLTGITIGDTSYTVPSGGGSSYTFTNGLTETDGTVSWDLNSNIKKDNNNNIFIRTDLPTLNNNISNNVMLAGTRGMLGGRTGNTKNNVIFGDNCGCGYWYSSISRVRENNIIGGDNCSVSGQYTASTPGDTAKNNIVVGSHLDTIGSNKLVIGQYNAIDTDDSKAIIVGNGTIQKRSNALTVSKTGIIECTNIPAPPSSDGEYNLHCSIVDGVATYSWEAATSIPTADGESF